MEETMTGGYTGKILRVNLTNKSAGTIRNYIYEQAFRGELLPMYDDKTKKWSYATGEGRKLDRTRFEEWKTKFYAFEGFNTANGWPTRKTLEDMGLKKVADVMQKKGRLG